MLKNFIILEMAVLFISVKMLSMHVEDVLVIRYG